jgi:hypothetical protein
MLHGTQLRLLGSAIKTTGFQSSFWTTSSEPDKIFLKKFEGTFFRLLMNNFSSNIFPFKAFLENIGK